MALFSDVNLYLQQTKMKPLGRNYKFFDSKSKHKKNNQQQQHSRSLSAQSDLARKSARFNLGPQKPVLTQKEIQIREGINHRYAKSKIRSYQFEHLNSKQRNRRSISRSSQQQEFKQMKTVKLVNLKDYHEQAQKRKQKEKSSKNRFKLRTDFSFIVKTEGSDRSAEKVGVCNPYLKQKAKKNGKEDWRFISIQFKEKSKSKTREIKMSSHRTLTAQVKSTDKMKSIDSKWKLKQFGKSGKKYRF